MNRTLVLNVVGMTPAFLIHAPNLTRLAGHGAMRPLVTVTPALTTTVQSTFVTGGLPREHGIVANGWYFRDLAEVWLWRQSNRLVQGKKLLDAARSRDPAFTCAKLFWWYNMYSSADIGVTPRPMYPADGRKLRRRRKVRPRPAGTLTRAARGRCCGSSRKEGVHPWTCAVVFCESFRGEALGALLLAVLGTNA